MEKNEFRAVIKHLHMKGQTINGDYYAALLDRFNILKKKCLHLTKKKVLFHQDNAQVHTCPTPMAKFNEFRYGELLPHPAYSPDLIKCIELKEDYVEK
ncbi:SETMR methyltransferase, partial [Acromyrmex charruanus]